MKSIFDEEETLLARRPVLSKMLAPILIESNPSITKAWVMTDLTYETPAEKRRRSKFEASQRAFDVTRQLNPLAKVPFLRPYIFGLNVLTYGLILLDPLDRLV
jgi:hypothetical protein